MFDFEKLQVYQKSKSLNKNVQKLIKQTKKIDPYIKDQLKRASISIVINIAEGSGKLSIKQKQQFYYIARASIYECVSLIDLIKEDNLISQVEYKNFYNKFEEISKMLMGLIKSCK